MALKHRTRPVLICDVCGAEFDSLATHPDDRIVLSEAQAEGWVLGDDGPGSPDGDICPRCDGST